MQELNGPSASSGQELNGKDTAAIYGSASKIWGKGEERNDELHYLVYREFGKESLRDLRREEIEKLKAILRRSNEGMRQSTGTRKIGKIAKLCYLLKWKTPAIRSWLRRNFNVGDWNDLSPAEANNAINQLTMIAKRDGLDVE